MSQRLPRYAFVRRAVRRFMPGETLEAALAEAAALRDRGLGTVLTYLGENIRDLSEADRVREHYLGVYAQIAARHLPTEISVKLTQLGLDLSPNRTLEHLRALARGAADHGNFLWLDIESSGYVEATLETYRRLRKEYANVGLCLQAYLYRTNGDLASLLPLLPSIRLVKGAYREPKTVAFPRKADVDRNFLAIGRMLLGGIPDRVRRVVIATHDIAIIEELLRHAKSHGLPTDAFEFHMLYGIKSDLQQRLVHEGWRVRTLISYGSAWFPWYMRRLAERPANVWFVARSIFR
jgi:proline dehydrogenase